MEKFKGNLTSRFPRKLQLFESTILEFRLSIQFGLLFDLFILIFDNMPLFHLIKYSDTG